MAMIKKISDDVFNGEHPNGVVAGYVKKLDIAAKDPVVGEVYWFGKFRTSKVTEIIASSGRVTKFKTKNSTYILSK